MERSRPLAAEAPVAIGDGPTDAQAGTVGERAAAASVA
jgi:hypothetical protein